MSHADKFHTYCSALSDEEKVTLLKKMSQNLSSLYKRKQKALESEGNSPLHSSRAKSTTLYANSHKISASYHAQIDDIKILIKTI